MAPLSSEIARFYTAIVNEEGPSDSGRAGPEAWVHFDQWTNTVDAASWSDLSAVILAQIGQAGHGQVIV